MYRVAGGEGVSGNVLDSKAVDCLRQPVLEPAQNRGEVTRRCKSCGNTGLSSWLDGDSMKEQQFRGILGCTSRCL